jgi:hypothetical protein
MNKLFLEQLFSKPSLSFGSILFAVYNTGRGWMAVWLLKDAQRSAPAPWGGEDGIQSFAISSQWHDW